jgi:biotin transport system substrate-specific component
MILAKPSIILASISDSKSSILTQLYWISIFVALTAVGAQIEIPHYPVPFTLQTFFVLLAAAFLGARNGGLSQVAYIAIGFIGAPVFSNAGFGPERLFGLTGGYLMGFPIAAYIVGYLVTKRLEFWWIVFSMFLGMISIFICGTLWLNYVAIYNIQQAIINGFLIFSWWDLIKISAAAAIYSEFAKRYRRLL